MTATVVDGSAPSVQIPHVGSTLHQTFKLTHYQFREYLRSSRFVVLAGIVVIIGAIITAVVAYFKNSSAVAALLTSNTAFYGSFWGGGVDFVIVLSAVFFGGDAIAGEFQNKTGYFLMGLPVRRTAIYVGKWIAAFMASVAMMGIFFLILLLNGVGYFGTGAFPWQLFASLALALVYLAAVLATTFVFSSLFKVSSYGFVLTAILFLFGFTLIQDLLSSLVKIQPWMVISYADAVIGNVFTSSIQLPGSGTPGTPGYVPGNSVGMPWGFTGFSYSSPSTFPRAPPTTVWVPGIGEGVVIMLGYFVIMGILGLWLFEREEFS